jgi:hypothetical protein
LGLLISTTQSADLRLPIPDSDGTACCEDFGEGGRWQVAGSRYAGTERTLRQGDAEMGNAENFDQFKVLNANSRFSILNFFSSLSLHPSFQVP